MRSLLAGVASLTVLAMPAGGAVVRIQVAGHDEGTAAGLEVVAKPLGQVGMREPRAQRWRVTGRAASGDLEPGLWQVTLQGAGVWSPATDILVTPNGPLQDVQLEAWATGFVTGEVEELLAQDGSLGPILLTVSGASHPPDGRVVPKTQFACETTQARFRCAVPAARLDLRVGMRDRVPRYLWATHVRPGATVPLGRVSLPIGASASGTVRLDGGEPAASVRVTLEPRIGVAAFTPAPGAPALPVAPTDGSGFFQLRGAPVGDWVVVARSADGREARVGVAVMAGRESEMTAPLVLSATTTLSIDLQPATAPDGSAWTVSLIAEGEGRAPLVVDALVPRSGQWRWQSTPVGTYRLTVSGAGGKWYRGSLQVEEGQGLVSIDLSPRQVQGVVRLGSVPLEARLVFGGAFGPIRITAEADAEGRFVATIPGELTVGDVLVEARQPPVRRLLEQVPLHADEIELVLPDTSIRGVLVDTRGRAVTHAVMTLMPEREGAPQQRVIRDEDGRFRIDGLAAGAYHLTAETKGLSSDEMKVDVPKEPKDTREVRIVMRRTRDVVLRVVSVAGEPVPGARFRVNPAQTPLGSAPVLATDVGGRAEVIAAPGTQVLGFTGGAPGFGYRIGRVAIPDSGEDIVVTLQEARGTLAVSLQKELSVDAGFAFLFHDGWFEDVKFLEHWTRSAPRPDGDGGSMWEFEGLEPGRYTLCRVKAAQLEATVLAGGRSGCHSGTLLPGASLALGVP